MSKYGGHMHRFETLMNLGSKIEIKERNVAKIKMRRFLKFYFQVY